MVNETETPIVGVIVSGSVVTASTIDWTTCRFPQPIDLSGMPDKFGGGAESVKAYAMWEEKDGVARAAKLEALANTLFDVYSSDSFTAKLLWEKLDQTHNTDSQGL
ncbi:hypothetical protein POM88_002892 [Heracleum sosnowskyi]|uniref:Uncharacterized protein n=1 Tax=Heracleum sosnowskyi TaxID=360622 RepID=A0AAD8JIS7_9APIA|nr:hypothetical protein POM88_002892 [Heracleum sosnowskyi]